MKTTNTVKRTKIQWSYNSARPRQSYTHK